MRTLAACGACRRKPIDKTATSTTGGGKAKSHGHAKWPAGLFVPGELGLSFGSVASVPAQQLPVGTVLYMYVDNIA